MSNLAKIFGLGFLCIVWGLNWVAIKISLEGLPPLISAGLRFFLAVIILFFYIKAKKISLKVDKKLFRLILITGFMTYCLDYGFVYWGEQYLSAGVTSIFFSTFALFTAIFTNFLFKNEPFQWKRYVGILIGFLGIMVIFFDQLIMTEFSLKVILAIISIILGALFAALPTVIIKKHLTQLKPEVLTFYQMTIGTFFLLLLGVGTENLQMVHLSMRIILVLLYMGLMASAAAFVVYYLLLKHMSAISLSLTIYVIPLVALLGDYLFYGQILSPRSFLGMATIFLGIWLSQRRRRVTAPIDRT